MRRRLTAALSMLVVLSGSVLLWADEQPTEEQAWIICGGFVKVTRLTQEFDSGGDPLQLLTLFSETGFTNACVFFWLKSDALIQSVPNSGFSTPWGVGYSDGFRQIVPPAFGTYTGRSFHFSSFLNLFPAVPQSYTEAQVTMVEPEEEEHAPPPEYCPVVFDMEGNGFQFTGQDDPVRFDLNADGLVEWVNWTVIGSDDAFLALDRNRNGKIDDGAELFGNSTPVYFDGPQLFAANGYEVLRFFESPLNGNALRDNRVTPADPHFGQLLLWTDRNHNGYSEPSELVVAAAAGLREISLDYRESRRRDRHGNELRQWSVSSWFADGVRKRIPTVDVWFLYSN